MLVKLSDYAAIKGVSPQAVRKAIKEKRLTDSVKKEGRGYLIDSELADKEWQQNTNESQQRSPQAINIGKSIAERSAVPNYTQARAFAEQYKAKLLELEFREKAKDLVRVHDVKVAVYKTNRQFRDAVNNIPIRIVSEMAAVVGNLSKEKEHEMLLIMQREIRTALEQLADSNGVS